MKKLFTLSIAILCVVAINAQGITESGNGFWDYFDYPDGTVYEDVAYDSIAAEWPDSSFITDGKLEFFLADSAEGYIGLWELEMDMTGYEEITFKYQFPASGGFGIWVEDNAGG
ncbi:MAG: hypothetical protein KAR17_05780, partial [Cyclobacteriaceae bacterium]|nr:hypothetical protein [Cyclobacteriaceae bacterium]